MKHLKTFENKFNSVENQYEPIIAEWYNKFINHEEFKEHRSEGLVTNEEVREFFDELQNEFDSDNLGDEIYQVSTYWKNSGTMMLGLYRAYGPNHAKIKYGFDNDDMSFINDTKYGSIEAYTIEEEEIKSKIEQIKSELSLWTDIK